MKKSLKADLKKKFILIFLLILIILLLSLFFEPLKNNYLKNNTFNSIKNEYDNKKDSFDYSPYFKKANGVLTVLINEYNYDYKKKYAFIKKDFEKETCIEKIFISSDRKEYKKNYKKNFEKENCILSYQKTYSFKTNESIGKIGYIIFKNDTQLSKFLTLINNTLYYDALKNNLTLIISDLNLISDNSFSINTQMMFLTTSKNLERNYYIFFWDKNILWFVKEKSNKKTIIRRLLGDSTNTKDYKKYISHYNITKTY